MSFRLACADFTFPLLSHDNSLDVIAMLGFEGVDIGLFEGRSHLHPSKEFANPAAARTLKQKTQDRGLKVADVFLQMDPDFVPLAINHPEASRRAKARDWFQRTLEYAANCESPHVTALPGANFEGESEADSIARSCDELAWRVEESKSAGIVFGTEAHVGSVVPTPDKALALVEAVPGLTLTLDYTHFTRAGLPDSAVEPLLAHASHFHVRGACEGRLQCAFKDNAIDYNRILELMNAKSYSGYVGVEYVWIDWEHCNEVDNLSETILFRDFIRSRTH
ncbi:MAG: sugar phosphate isomerase/epimerase [Planctomycetaceae bacterium]|nr:sugar phosphate isomerase/epimerase [Planctomycetaceae bacterium]MCB9952745.1 sugar phosphate isomerase/epimerase [Planctomycetaceae bacterium]